MSDQQHHWSKVADRYEEEFIDPYHADAHNPLFSFLGKLAGKKKSRQVADLGCGIGPLLPYLAEQFKKVHAVDFAENMIKRAKERCKDLKNVEFHQLPLTGFAKQIGVLDIAVAINSLVMPSTLDLDICLTEINACLRSGGTFVAIVPAMDAVHYHTMLLLDRALEAGKPLEAARKNAAHFAEHQLFDFAFGQFKYKGLNQHFWQPFEINYRLKKAGFVSIHIEKVQLAWAQFAQGNDLSHFEPPWDWLFIAEKP